MQIRIPILIPFKHLIFCIPLGDKPLVRVTELQQRHHGMVLTLIESARLTVEDYGSHAEYAFYNFIS